MFPEVILTLCWFAFALSFPGVGAFFVRTFDFDARAALVAIYCASIAARVVGEKCDKGIFGCSKKLLKYLGIALSVLTILTSLWAVRASYGQGR